MRSSDWSSDVCSSDLRASANIAAIIERIDLGKNEQTRPEYLAKNPWAKVPALEIGDVILTENVAILTYIAEQAPAFGLLPVSGMERARALDWLALLSITVPVAFRPIFLPGRLAVTGVGLRGLAAPALEGVRAVIALPDGQV